MLFFCGEDSSTGDKIGEFSKNWGKISHWLNKAHTLDSLFWLGAFWFRLFGRRFCWGKIFFINMRSTGIFFGHFSASCLLYGLFCFCSPIKPAVEGHGTDFAQRLELVRRVVQRWFVRRPWRAPFPIDSTSSIKGSRFFYLFIFIIHNIKNYCAKDHLKMAHSPVCRRFRRKTGRPFFRMMRHRLEKIIRSW